MKKIITLFCLIFVLSCGNDEDNVNYDIQNEEDIQNYISTNNLSPERTTTGLYYIIDTEGNGEFPSANDDVTVSYRGYLLNGINFDQSDNATFPVDGVIPGFGEALQLLSVGGSGTFILPSRLAYGSSSLPRIPAGSVLVFDIELLSID